MSSADLTPLTEQGRGAVADTAFRVVALLSGLAVLVILAAIAISTSISAWPAVQDQGLYYFFGTEWAPSAGKYGIVPLAFGTVLVSLIAVFISVPLSLGIALFTTEVAPDRLRRPVITVIDLMAAVPSVVFGIWAFYNLLPGFQSMFNSIADAVSGIPILNSIFGPSSGSAYMSAGMILALMITPIITSVAREVFTTVPVNDKSGALALGATKWEMIKGVVIPHSFGGLTGAVMLGFGRALGETVAVALIIGAVPNITTNLFAKGETMPAQIFRQLSEASSTFRAALIGLGVCLFIITIFVNISARRIVAVVDRRVKGD